VSRRGCYMSRAKMTSDSLQGNRAKKFWTNGLSAESVAIH
jgi:hypothetical protein